MGWIGRIANAIGTNLALVILEPDALANLDCPSLTSTQRTERVDLLSNAVMLLKTYSAALVYLDGGHSDWQTVLTMTQRFTAAGLTNADGFVLNVSNFQTDSNTIACGSAISRQFQDMHFIIDTSRNGLGPYTNPADPATWCDPPGRALGRLPTMVTDHALVDAYLWIKNPGESDGACRSNAPPSGVFWPDYALGLAGRVQY